MKDLKFKNEVLLNGLKMSIATISILIDTGCKDNDRLVFYTNYYISIALKSFYEFNKLDKDYTKKDMTIKKYNLIYNQNFLEAQKNPTILNDYFKLKTEYSLLSVDTRFIIFALLSLSSYYKTNSINKIKNIIRTYIPKLKRCIKSSSSYYRYFNITKYDNYQIKCLLFKFLIENS